MQTSISDRNITPIVITFAVALGIMTTALRVHAQDPQWTVDAASYQYTMSIVAFVSVDGRLLTSENDRVAAFVNDEVRGVANPIYIASAGRYLAYFTVFGNKQGEEVKFKIFDSTAGKVAGVEASVKFEIDGQTGNVFQAYSIASPALRKDAEVINFSFADTDSISTVIADGGIDITVEFDDDLSALTPEFVVSPGAKVYIGRTLQESGDLILDFREPVTYAVLSEDESVLKTYIVTVSNRQTAGEGFACTNVITPNGDGSNDYWIVQDAFKYEGHNFTILDANGRVLFRSTGYANDWDGSLRNGKVARGKYYYVVVDPVTGDTITGDILVLY